MLEEIKEYYGYIQLTFALILGMVLQYLMGNKKGRRVFLLILVSTLFTAMLVSNLIMLLDGRTILGLDFDITPTSPLIIIGVGLSALLSMEVVAIISLYGPKSIRKRLKEEFDLKEVNDEL